MLIVGQFLLYVVLIKSCIIVKIDLSVRTDDDKKMDCHFIKNVLKS